MPLIRRGGYVFILWKGDHGPRHVHVWRDRKLVLKWDLDHNGPLKGHPIRRVLRLIGQLRAEGILYGSVRSASITDEKRSVFTLAPPSIGFPTRG